MREKGCGGSVPPFFSDRFFGSSFSPALSSSSILVCWQGAKWDPPSPLPPLRRSGRKERKRRIPSILTESQQPNVQRLFSWTVDHLYASLIFLVNRWRLQRLGGKKQHYRIRPRDTKNLLPSARTKGGRGDSKVIREPPFPFPFSVREKIYRKGWGKEGRGGIEDMKYSRPTPAEEYSRGRNGGESICPGFSR